MKLLLKDTPVTIRFFEKYPKSHFIDTVTEFDFLIADNCIYRSVKYKGRMYCKIDMIAQRVLPIHMTRHTKREHTMMMYADKKAWQDIGIP